LSHSWFAYIYFFSAFGTPAFGIPLFRHSARKTIRHSARSAFRHSLDSSPVLVDVTISHQCWGNSTGFRSDNESISSWPSWSTRRCTMQLQHISCRRLPACLSRRWHRPSPATIGRHRHVLRSTD